MSQSSDIHVLIAAAGSGTRFGGAAALPKQYHDLLGQSILRRTILKFKNINKINNISCIINPIFKEEYAFATKNIDLAPHSTGGKTRKESIFNGLKNINEANNEDIILIHDAARPLIPEDDILKLIDALETSRAATLARPVSETLRKGENNHCSDIVSRDSLWAIQTPQAFRYGDIMKAHEQSRDDIEYTDDTSLITAIGIDVALVEGSAENIKITTKNDMRMAEKLLSTQTSTRTGLGFDVHAFDAESSGPIRIGGIDIEYDKKLKGHSDADVALHAITDAILGAIGKGDIGQHFPPSDDTFKNMDSAIFLQKAHEMALKQNASINNIDLTIICEEPKIGPHAAKMRHRIASILNLNESAINIKATTTERLGFTGKKEGIAAQAVATVTQNG